jgi:hypothetical protein
MSRTDKMEFRAPDALPTPLHRENKESSLGGNSFAG